MFCRNSFAVLLLLGAGPLVTASHAQEDAPAATVTAQPAGPPEAADVSESADATTPSEPTESTDAAEGATAAAPDAGKLIPLNPKGTVKIDRKRKLVVVDGRIALRAGQLEMFACPAGTKEHESVIALLSDSKTIHAGLLAVGARPGAVVKWDPVYSPAYGDVLEVYVLWKDAEGKPHQVRGQSWVRDVKTGEEMKSDWIFAGSGFWTDPSDGIEYYYADGGEAICVSNFPTAMVDLPIQSSQANDSLLFEAFESRIPARNTPVRVVLRLAPNTDTTKSPQPAAQAATPETSQPGEAPEEPAESPAPAEPPAESSAEPVTPERDPAPPADAPESEAPQA